jgi:threonine dehydrogenase-like Zn-dependent dehydrogenase
MRASVLRDGRMVLRDDVPEPVPGPGQVLVEVKACGICGSDLHFAKHGQNVLNVSEEMSGLSLGDVKIDLSEDVFMGHEFSAEILEAGPDTEAPAPGTVVTSIPVLLSATGLDPIVYSNTMIGGYAERMLLSAPLLLPVPNGLDPKRAALTEPMAVGVPGIINDVMRRAPMGSRLIVAGVCMEPDTVLPFFGTAKEISVQFVFAYDPNEFADSLRAIAEGEIDVAPLITGEVPLDGVGEAFDELAHPDAHCKIVVTPSR